MSKYCVAIELLFCGGACNQLQHNYQVGCKLTLVWFVTAPYVKFERSHRVSGSAHLIEVRALLWQT